jgi:hypothetical protein
MPANYKLALAALAGFLLGAWLFHTRTVKAQYSKVSVKRVTQGSNMLFPSIDGTEVVGFSCTNVDGQAECYVVTH